MFTNICGHDVSETDVFCPECGSKIEVPPENFKELMEFKQLAAQYLDDGILEDWEETHLKQRARELGIRQSTYNEIVKVSQPLNVSTIKIAYDAISMSSFVAEQHCQIRLSLENIDQVPIRELIIEYVVTPIDVIYNETLKKLPPKQSKIVALPFMPEKAGQYAFEAVVTIHNFNNQTLYYYIPSLQFAVKDKTTMPSSITYNVDAGVRVASEKYGSMVEGSNIHIDALPKSLSDGGVLGEYDFKSISAKPISQVDVQQFVIKHEQRFVRRGQKTNRSVTSVFIREKYKTTIKAKTYTLTTIDQKVFVTSLGESMTLGRDPKQVDQPLWVEPCMPPQQHLQNFSKTKDISSNHCCISIQNHIVNFTDTSANGSTIDDTKISRGTTVALDTGSKIQIAKSLLLKSTLWKGVTGMVETVVFERIDNCPEKRHVLIKGAVGVWMNSSEILGSPIGAAVTLEGVDEWLCLVNRSSAPMQVGIEILEIGEAVPLKSGDMFAIQGKVLMVK